MRTLLFIKGMGSMAKQRHSPHVGKMEFSMQRHIHMHTISTYFNIDGVEKKASATRKRALNQTLTVECNVILKQSCGTVGIPTSRKEQNTPKATVSQ
jgi:hypothetical protein